MTTDVIRARVGEGAAAMREGNYEGASILELDDYPFARAWADLPTEEKAKLPAQVKAQALERYRKLTPWVAQSIGRAQAPTSFAPSSDSLIEIECVRLSQIESRPVKWLWLPYFPLAKPILLSGDPGISKSVLVAAIGACVTRGALWPVGNERAPLGDVLILSAEDDAADTLKPRLETAGADCDRVHVIRAVREIDHRTGADELRLLALRTDLKALEDELSKLKDCRLVIIDPISAYLDGIDSHSNAEVRGVLALLAGLAERSGAAFLIVSHLNKGTSTALYRTTGSLAFVAAVRAAYVVMRDKDDRERRLFLPIKNNLAADRLGFAYRVRNADGVPMLDFEPNPIDVDADEALRQSTPDDLAEGSRVKDAKAWLADLLLAGAVSVQEIRKRARGDGFGWRTIERAKSDLKVRSAKGSLSGGWTWALAQQELPE